MSGLAPTREVLASGVTVLAKRTSTTPAVTLIANIRAGSVRDTAQDQGLAHFVSRTIDRGTDRHSADDADLRRIFLLSSSGTLREGTG